MFRSCRHDGSLAGSVQTRDSRPGPNIRHPERQSGSVLELRFAESGPAGVLRRTGRHERERRRLRGIGRVGKRGFGTGEPYRVTAAPGRPGLIGRGGVPGERLSGTADESDLFPVGRPGRARVPVDRGRHVGNRAGGDIINADEAMVPPVAGERDLAAVGREHRTAVGSPSPKQRRLALVSGSRDDRSSEDLAAPVAFPSRPFSIRRKHGTRAGPEAERSFILDSQTPDGLIAAVRQAGRIGHPADVVGVVTPDKENNGTVVRDAQARQIDAIVRIEAGQADRLEIGRRGGPDVSLPLIVGQPGDPVRLLGRHKLIGKGIRNELGDGRLSGRRRRGRGDEDSEKE